MEQLAFPWVQIAGLLRNMSLQGGVGNVFAWILWAVIGMIPLIYWVIRRKHSIKVQRDIFLPIISILVLTGIWFLINPSYLYACFLPVELAGSTELAGGVVAIILDTVILTYIVWNFMSSVERAERERLFRNLRILLGCYTVFLAFALAWQFVNGLQVSFNAFEAGNTMLTGDMRLLEGEFGKQSFLSGLGTSYFFLVLQQIVKVLPACLELPLCILNIRFLMSTEKAGFSDEALGLVTKIYKWSKGSLIAILVSQLSLNILQLLCAKGIRSTNFNLTIPVEEIVKVLLVLVLSCFYMESKKIKDDNDMFI